MSDFLLIIPPGWTEIPNAEVVIGDPAGFQDMLSRESWGEIEGVLDNSNLTPAGQTVAEARLLETTAGFRLWVRFVPLV